MKLRARADGSPILICVASDCDAIAANHIFTVNQPHLHVCRIWRRRMHQRVGGLGTPTVPFPLVACALFLVEGGPRDECSTPPWSQPRGKSMASLVNSHTNATRIGWHLWEIDLRFAPGLPSGGLGRGKGKFYTARGLSALLSYWPRVRAAAACWWCSSEGLVTCCHISPLRCEGSWPTSPARWRRVQPLPPLVAFRNRGHLHPGGNPGANLK